MGALMAPATQLVDEQSLVLSAPELGVACGLMGLAADVGVDVGAGLTRAEVGELAKTALRSLARRGLVVHVDGDPAVPRPVARLLEVACRPAVRVELFVRDGPGRGVVRHHHLRAQPEAGVELRDVDGGYRCTPFGTADLLLRVAELAGLEGLGPAVGDAAAVTWGAFLRARAVGATGDRDAARSILVGDGASALVADDLAAALSGEHRVAAAQLRHRVSATRREGAEVAWLQAGRRAWRLPAIDSPFARDRERAVDTSDVPVSIAPVDAQTLLRALGSALPVDLSDDPQGDHHANSRR